MHSTIVHVIVAMVALHSISITLFPLLLCFPSRAESSFYSLRAEGVTGDNVLLDQYEGMVSFCMCLESTFPAIVLSLIATTSGLQKGRSLLYNMKVKFGGTTVKCY